MRVTAARSGADAVIARLAAGQGGAVARHQLIAEGVTRHQIATRLASGILTPVHPGVYAVGCPVLSPLGGLWAAVLAGGPGTVASFDTAAWRHGWLGAGGTWHVTRIGDAARLPGLWIHGARSLAATDVCIVDGIPCTSPARTLFDLAASRPRRVVERCLDQWEQEGRYDSAALKAAARPGRAGCRLVLRLDRDHAVGTTVTRSFFEEEFLAFCRRRGIRQPWLNVPMTLGDGTPIVVDTWWPEERVAIELDGRATHARARAFEADPARDLELQAMGVETGRITWRRLTREPARVERNLRAILGRRRV